MNPARGILIGLILGWLISGGLLWLALRPSPPSPAPFAQAVDR